MSDIKEVLARAEAEARKIIERTPAIRLQYGAKPPIVCLCGSSRFVDLVAAIAWEFEKLGAITLAMHLLPHWYGAPEHHAAEADGVAEILDLLHLRKIEMADIVFVVNYDHYVGERTAIEIEHAKKLGKRIAWLLPQPSTA